MNTVQQSRRELLKMLGFGAASMSLSSSLVAEEESKRKDKLNVLFIAVDDLRPQINCYGHKQMISPNLDRLAADGVIFGRCYCQVPVCGASRASLLTGVRPARDRFVSYSTRADEDMPGTTTLPKHFRNNGYHTISNGKVFHHKDDYEASWSETPWRPTPKTNGSWRNYLLEENVKIANQSERGAGPPFESADVPDNAYFDGGIADKTISDLQRMKEMDKPFFLAAGFLKPHLPFNAPQKYWDMYKREEIDLADNPFRPKGAPDAAMHNWGELRNYHGVPEKGPLSDDFARTLVHGYYACVSYTDAQIGRVLDELEKLDLRENTVIVLWGDHGWNLREHGLWCKHCNFETSLHSPLLVSAPGIDGGKRTEALTEFVDIYPSLCELCGLGLPSHLEGLSFVPLMKNTDLTWKKAVFSRYYNGDSIKTDRYRYTEWTRDNGIEYARMLYDHNIDPMENINIAELPENHERIERLKGMIQKGWRSVLPGE